MSATATRPRLLIVDDNALIRRVVYDFFMPRGYRVDAADDGTTALEHLDLQTPDVIIADILMPSMDGWRFFEEVRNRDETAETPFIFLTTEKELPKRLHGYRLGAEDYITKPFEIEELHARVEVIIKRYRALLAARRGEDSLLSGSLEHMGMADLIQFHAMGGKDGVIRIDHGKSIGFIHIFQGEIVHASVGGVTGTKALYRMLGWEKAVFRVSTSNGIPKEKTMAGSANNILMDGLVSLDEWKRWEGNLPSGNTVLTIAADARERLGERKVGPVEYDVLKRSKKGCTLGNILDQSSQPDGAVACAICTLLDTGVLKIASDS